MLTPTQAMDRLQAGNRRFADGASISGGDPVSRLGEVAAGQSPFAVILGCADSRVPPEIVFDQGLGDLFVIRVAGNIAGPSQIGTVEFAALSLGTRLVVVLGHSRCGAVSATVDALTMSASRAPANLQSIVDQVRPAVEPLFDANPNLDREHLIQEGVRENVAATVNGILDGSEVLKTLARDDGLRVVGAEYLLDTGEVDFFTGPGDLR